MRRTLLRLIFASIVLGSGTVARAGQLGVIVAPGPLSKAHAKLEGVVNCARCHEGGRQQSAVLCLSCHKPIAERIARKTGVHRAAGGDCVKCHIEHSIGGAELRPLDTQKFDHAAQTGFVLEGRHASPSVKCSACHLKRSFLEARPVCSSCHTDVHKNNLGNACASCHSPNTPFKETRTQFDHARAQFALTGAHRTVACAKCHVTGVFRGLPHDMCSTCHQEPHRKKFGPTCTSCHTTEQWATRTVDHAKTGFVLVGAHTQVACAKCHTTGITKPLRFDKCSACHVNVHRESAKEDCRACHTEVGFRGAKFDHTSRTPFPLVGKHDGLACRKCHTSIAAEDVPFARKVVDFGGLKTECAGCHEDTKHKGEYGRVCDMCHRPATFKASDFKHPQSPDFYAGRHASATCAQCHLRAGPQPMHAASPIVARTASPIVSPGSKTPSMACAACHADVHLGQVGAACERCHSIDAERFAPVRFSHEKSAFKLTGKHETVECAKCHVTETRAFPAGQGTATRLNPMATECRACHKDPHLGQIVAECSTCHSPATFSISAYTHRGNGELFSGFHGKLACPTCHKTETGQFPAGHGTAVRFNVGNTCAACHKQH